MRVYQKLKKRRYIYLVGFDKLKYLNVTVLFIYKLLAQFSKGIILRYDYYKSRKLLKTLKCEGISDSKKFDHDVFDNLLFDYYDSNVKTGNYKMTCSTLYSDYPPRKVNFYDYEEINFMFEIYCI